MKARLLILMNALWVISCTQSFPGRTSIQAVRSVGHCQYATDLVEVDSLYSVQPLTGALGSFVETSKTFVNDSDYYTPDYSYVNTRFQFANNGYYAKDYASLTGASLYFYMEQIQKLFSSIDTRSDLFKIVPNLKDTLIYYKVEMKEGKSLTDMSDNAAYFKPSPFASGIDTRNFIFTFPNDDITSVPLPLNPGVIGHEMTHFVSQYLWRQNLSAASIDSYGSTVMDSLDEGFSDYSGFIFSRDPGFFNCSFPNENRDLSVFKHLSSIQPPIGSSNYDIHAGGAVWAAVQYQIGQLLSSSGTDGHVENLKSLVQLFGNLQSCPGYGNLTFQSINRCHINLIGNRNSQIQQIYNQAFDMGGY